MKRLSFTEEANHTERPKGFPYYVVELGDHCYLTDVYQGKAVDGPLHMARLYPEDMVRKAADEAHLYGGKVQVVYMSDPISLQEFCDRSDTSSVTREKCLPYCK